MARISAGGGRYCVVVWGDKGADPFRHHSETPVGALATAIRYLRKGRHVVLSAKTVEALADSSLCDDIGKAAELAAALHARGAVT